MVPLAHDNLVKLYGGCWSDGPDKLCIVLEFCSGGSLYDLLKHRGALRLTWAEPLYGIVLGITRCFAYLHYGVPRQQLIHRDLKPANVLLTEDMTAKVADFGESRTFEGAVEGDEAATMTMVGTPLCK